MLFQTNYCDYKRHFSFVLPLVHVTNYREQKSPDEKFRLDEQVQREAESYRQKVQKKAADVSLASCSVSYNNKKPLPGGVILECDLASSAGFTVLF